jgi:hypothetical protein
LELHRGGGRSRTSGSPGLQEFDSALSIKFRNGALGNISIVGNSPTWHEDITFWCSEGMFLYRNGHLQFVDAAGKRHDLTEKDMPDQAYRYRRPRGGARYQLLFPLVRVNFELGVIMVIAVSCVKLLSAHNSTQHTSRKHKV